jgi:simple sugar transport system substrate-binding protein
MIISKSAVGAAIAGIAGMLLLGAPAHAQEAREIKVSYVCAESDIPFFAPLKRGAEDAAKAEGVTLRYTGISSSDISAPTMAKIMTAAINQGPDALIVCSFFPDAQRPVMQQAIDQGIPVFVVEGGQEDIDLGATTAFGINNETAGLRAADEMTKLAPEAKKVLCVNQLPEDPNVAARCIGLTKGLSGRGVQVETLNLANANIDQTRFVAGVQSALSNDKDIDVVFALGARQAEGVVLAAEAAGRNDVQIAGFDVSEQLLKNIEQGKTLFTVWQQPYVNGYLAVVSAVMKAKYGMALPGIVSTGPVFISKDNLDAVKVTREAGLL